MRRILHVDMDAFYASVEQLDEPRYRDRPVIVGADPRNGRGRGVVAACSYEARRFGVRSALPISQAWRLCPAGVYVRPRMERYRELSSRIMDLFNRYTDLVEPLSVDEAFLDVTGSTRLLGTPEDIGRAIRKEVFETTGLTASVGVAPNKFLAKIASDLEKPNALVVVNEAERERFLAPLPISRLWGVGPRTTARLRGLGLRTIGDLQELSGERLATLLGAQGEHLWRLARGEDDRAVVPRRLPQSISRERTFDADTRDARLVALTLRRLADAVARDLRAHGYRARRVVLKLRYASFRTFTRQASLPRGVQSGGEIFAVAHRLLGEFLSGESVRLVGVGTSHFADAGMDSQMGLFPEPPARPEAVEKLMDRIQGRYGRGSIGRASDLPAGSLPDPRTEAAGSGRPPGRE